jgi:hypothetical protein
MRRKKPAVVTRKKKPTVVTRRRKPTADPLPVDEAVPPKAVVAPPSTGGVPAPDPYADAVHGLALRERDRILDVLDESTLLSNSAKLIDGAVTLAGTASADWYLTTEIASFGDGGGPGLGRLMRWRAGAGTIVTADEFRCVAVLCSFYYLFAVMADRDRLSAARLYLQEIDAPPVLSDLVRELERYYPTRRLTPRPKTNYANYLAHADLRIAECLHLDNSPGLSVAQAAKVIARFSALHDENVVPVVHRVS